MIAEKLIKNRKQNEPILVTGSHRSGTTWIGRSIAFDSRIKYIQEPFNVDYPNRGFAFELDTWYLHIPYAHNKEIVYNEFSRVLGNSNGRPYSANFLSSKNIYSVNISRCLKNMIINKILKKRILIKDPLSLISAGWLYEQFGFDVICMIRNPLGFVGSLKKWNWNFDFSHFLRQKDFVNNYLYSFSGEIERFTREKYDVIDQACLLWNILHTVILLYKENFPNWLYVRHEDVAMDPLSEFEKIFSYINIQMSKKIQTRIIDYTSSKNRKEASNTSFQALNSKASLDSWRYRLNTSEVNRVVQNTIDLASKFYKYTEKGFT